MRYLLNSAVITGPGRYSYRLITPEEAAAWLRQGNFISRIGYPTAADQIHAIAGIRPKLSREYTGMQPGDEALVIRLKYRITDPNKKASHIPAPEDWEYGILVKEE
ncbi:DUF1874 domain-containing protein [Moorellaceae bacterium AZ2]